MVAGILGFFVVAFIALVFGGILKLFADKTDGIKFNRNFFIKWVVALVCCSVAILIFSLLNNNRGTNQTSNNIIVDNEESENTNNTENETSGKYNAQAENSSNAESHFLEAVKSIGMDSRNIKNIDSLPDWASGKRYSFMYDGFRYVVYELDDGEIDSINTDNNYAKIYERGFEPLNYKDFEPDMNIVLELQADAANKLVKYIDGEISSEVQADTISRIYDFYSISGTVKAKNFADKKTFSFSACYKDKECVFLSFEDTIIFGSDKKPDIKKREIVDRNDKSVENETIVLSYGKEGTYGKVDYFDGEPYIRYYVPAGDYNVSCNIRGGFYIETIELHKEDGCDTADTIRQQKISPSDNISITVKEGECISLYINSEIVLTKK